MQDTSKLISFIKQCHKEGMSQQEIRDKVFFTPEFSVIVNNDEVQFVNFYAAAIAQAK